MSIAGYNCIIQYLKGKDNACTDLLSCAVDASEDNEDPPVDTDDRSYLVSAINSNRFEPKQFASYKNDNTSMTYERPTLTGIDMIGETKIFWI